MHGYVVQYSHRSDSAEARGNLSRRGSERSDRSGPSRRVPGLAPTEIRPGFGAFFGTFFALSFRVMSEERADDGVCW